MKIAKLGDVADWGSGGTPKRGVAEYFGEGTPWLSISDLNDDVVHEAAESLTPLGIANSSAKVVRKGTIFVAMYGSIGKLGIAGRDMCTSQAIAFARPRESLIDRRYLFHYLLSERRFFQAKGRGGTQMNIGQADLKNWPVPLPPLVQQRRIAAILDQADALRAQRTKVLSRIKDLPGSLFTEMFNMDCRDLRPLHELAEVSSGITKGRKMSGQAVPVPYLAVANVQAGHLNLDTVKEIEATPSEIERYLLKDGDLLLTEGGDPDKLGRGTLWRNELPICLHQNHIFRVRVTTEQILPGYLSAFMAGKSARSYFLRAAKQTTGIASINSTQLKALPVPVPPLRQQQLFVERAAATEAQRAQVERVLASDNELFAALQFRAFRGEL